MRMHAGSCVLAVEHLPDQPPPDCRERYEEWHANLEDRLTQAVRQKCGNPLVVWLLLNIVVPIVVKLVLEWWSNRKE